MAPRDRFRTLRAEPQRSVRVSDPGRGRSARKVRRACAYSWSGRQSGCCRSAISRT